MLNVVLVLMYAIDFHQELTFDAAKGAVAYRWFTQAFVSGTIGLRNVVFNPPPPPPRPPPPNPAANRPAPV